MKSIKHILLLVVIVSFSTNVYSQLWKQYSDSAKTFSDQKKMDKAIEYYTKAKEEFQKDSVGTVSYAQNSHSLANSYFNIHQYAKAESFFLEAKQIREKKLGKDHPDYAASCHSLGHLYYSIGKYEKAESLYVEAKQIREKVLGKNHPDYAQTCNNLAALYTLMVQYKKAEPLYIEAKEIREKVLGKEHPDYAASCDNLAVLYTLTGQYGKAETLYLEALKIRAHTLGKEHPVYATSCDNLANFYNITGKYRKAEPLYINAKSIRGKLLGKDDPAYAKSCNNLAVLYWNMGQYAKAEPLYLEAKKISGKIFGKEDPDYAVRCNNLASLYSDMGQYENAEPLFLQAKQISEKALGKVHPDYATSCHNLAALYTDMGQYEKAEPIYLEAIQIREKVFGKEHPDYAFSCNNLANLYSDMGQYEKAEPLFLEAKQIREKAFGKEHPDYAVTCDNLASLYIYMSEYKKAESFYLEAKSIREKVLGKKHPNYAESCNNLAGLYKDIGQYEKAESLYLEAKQIREKSLSKEHPGYVSTCSNLAGLFWQRGQYEKAGAYYVKALYLQRSQAQKIFQFTSEVEKQSYLKKTKAVNNSFFSFNYSGHSSNRQKVTYDVALSSRNLILSSFQKLRSAIYNTSNTSIKNKYNNWINLREQISFWHTKPIAKRPSYLNDLEEEANTLEKELTRLSSAFKKEQGQSKIDWKTIQQSLKTNEAAIEFVEFEYYNGKRDTDSVYYFVLLLRNDKQEPRFIQLFEKKQLDTLLNISEDLDIDNRINTLYTGNQSLYNLIWKPLEKYLNGISGIYFASAGNLFKISLAAIPINDNLVLGDKYQLFQLNTPATVTDNDQSFITAADKIQLYGGIKYDADSATLKKAASRYQSSANSRSFPDDLSRGELFKYLPGTQKEVEEIKNQTGNTGISVNIDSSINATEESVKALTGKNSPSVLHIATHGFFFPDPKIDKRAYSMQQFEKSGKPFKQSDNPLVRSGLIFAGANNAWQGKPIDSIEDGILTAYEVSNMYLRNTKLVVLSACETALGDIQGSEGVYGLQRAFKMAGVQNLVMSLWKVPDAETTEFMQLFYKNLFAKQTISNAFYNAQQVMKNKYRAEPYMWAAWVLVR